MRASEKCSGMYCIEVDTDHRITSLHMLYVVTLIYFSGSQHFQKYINIQYLENGESFAKTA